MDPSAYIIGLSANAQETDRDIAVDAGMDAFLTKPVRKANLLTSIEHALQRSKKAR